MLSSDHARRSPILSDEDRRTAFPWGPVRAVAALFGVHMLVVLFLVGPRPSTPLFVRLGGLVAGPLVAKEPWRLLTHLFIHSGPSHAFWNGLSMMVFAVPLIMELGYGVTATIYLAGGVAGGIAGSLMVPEGVVLIGSSGAVASLFGAWISITLLRARVTPLPRQAVVKIVGVALLVLPSFLSPATVSGEPISVGSHLGGLAAGLAAGAILWGLGRVPLPPQGEPGEGWEDEPEDLWQVRRFRGWDDPDEGGSGDGGDGPGEPPPWVH